MTKEDLEPIAKLVEKYDLYVLSDEIYSELTYKTDHVSIASFWYEGEDAGRKWILKRSWP